MVKKRDDSNVFSIRDGKPVPASRSPKLSGRLTSNDPALARLLKSYFEALGLQPENRSLVSKELALAILNYETRDPIDLLVKLTVLECEFGCGPDILTDQPKHERLLFAYFRRALIQYIDDMTRLLSSP